jgi:hypothetical protein
MGTVTPQPDADPQRLEATREFAEELRRLAEIAPEPFRSQLLALAEQSSGDTA